MKKTTCKTTLSKAKNPGLFHHKGEESGGLMLTGVLLRGGYVSIPIRRVRMLRSGCASIPIRRVRMLRSRDASITSWLVRMLRRGSAYISSRQVFPLQVGKPFIPSRERFCARSADIRMHPRKDAYARRSERWKKAVKGIGICLQVR